MKSSDVRTASDVRTFLSDVRHIIGCETVEQRNTAVRILHDDLGFSTDGTEYAQRYYDGATDTEWLCPHCASGNIEFYRDMGFFAKRMDDVLLYDDLVRVVCYEELQPAGKDPMSLLLF